MSGELTPVGGAAAESGNVISQIVKYGLVVASLAAAGIRLAGLSERVRGTYRYVERCAAGVDQLADQMAGLAVDDDTVTEHHDAAAVMRSVLEEAEAMAAATEDLSVAFSEASAAHQADYGSVADAANAMTVPMADAQFYSNR
jgi:hypothetical protein